MKRLLTMMVAMVMMSLCAKAEHLTFMGIPIDGSPAQFEKALLAKGFTPDNDSNKDCGPNEKWFNGVYYNEKVQLGIYYTPKSKKIYSVGLGFDNYSQKSAYDKYKDLCKSIRCKYPTSFEEAQEPDSDEFKRVHFDIGNIGRIGLFLFKDNTISIIYCDIENTHIYGREKDEDI